MSMLLAFRVANYVPMSEPAELKGYDAELQTLVWEADQPLVMSALCTVASSGWRHCASTGSACDTSGANCHYDENGPCYHCDF